MIYISFITAFLVIAPIITLYATGYSYNFKKNKIEKTGIIVIESQPRDAMIFINGEYEKDTPTKFSRVLPDVYEVTVRKDGYHEWKKDLRVESNITTFANYIELFKNNLPITIAEGDINVFITSPDQTKLVYSIIKETTEELRLLNLKNGSDFLIEELSLNTYNDLIAIEWFSQNRLLVNQVIGDFNSYLVVNADNFDITEVFDITRTNFDTMKWGDDGNLYGLRRAVLHQINLLEKNDTTILSANITDFQIKGGDIIFIEKLVNESILNKMSLESTDEEEAIKIKLPSPSDFKFHSSPSGFITLIDTKNQDLFILRDNIFNNKDIPSNIVLQDTAKKVFWSKNQKDILFYNDFEISVFNIDFKNKNLITRYGDQINQAFWHVDNPYVIYQINDSVKAIEASSEEQKNDTILASLPIIKEIALDDSGKNVYMVGKVGAQEGIFKLEIK